MRFAKTMLVGGGLVPLVLHASPAAAEENVELTMGIYEFQRHDGQPQYCDIYLEWSYAEDGDGVPIVGPMGGDVQIVNMWDGEGSHCDVASGTLALAYEDASGRRQVASTNFYDAGFHDVNVSEAAPYTTGPAVVGVTITWADCDAAVSTCTVTQFNPEK
jgi:hypothetical protein